VFKYVTLYYNCITDLYPVCGWKVATQVTSTDHRRWSTANIKRA